MDYYEIDDKNLDKALLAFQGDISAEPNEYGMIELTVINKNPFVSSRIANYIVKLVDSLNIEFNMQQAKNNRGFIEKRYIQNVSDLRKAEDSLYKFQKKFGIVAVPEQLEVTVKAAAEIEAELTKKELQSHFILQGYGESSPQYQGIKAEIKLLKEKVQELKNSSSLSSSSNILFAFKDMPNIAIQYLRTYREVEIQQSILEIIMPMYEQAKVEEQKSIPTMVFIDKAVPPQLKYRPQRAFIILGFLAISFFILLPFVFRMEKLVNKSEYVNSVEKFEMKYYSKIQKLFRVVK
jgi:capsule polysaccharide export protein KpsE/RkpR